MGHTIDRCIRTLVKSSFLSFSRSVASMWEEECESIRVRHRRVSEVRDDGGSENEEEHTGVLLLHVCCLFTLHLFCKQ